MLLRSPLAHPDAVVVPRKYGLTQGCPEMFSSHAELLSPYPLYAELIWNLYRLEGRARITLEQNCHFYRDLPRTEGAFDPGFYHHSMKDFNFQKRRDRVYVLVDRPGRVFLTAFKRNRIFGNVWMVNGTLIFRGLYRIFPTRCLFSDISPDIRGCLEGERLVRNDIPGPTRWYCEPIATPPNSESRARLNHNCIPAITTTPLANPVAQTTFEDWTVLTRPELDFFNIHIFDERVSLPVSTESMVCLSASGMAHDSDTRTLTSDHPEPPTSERPGYQILYTTIDTLTDDELLGAFNQYRLDNGVNWNTQLGWRNLSHVCRRWRRLVYGSAAYLDMQILCTNGTPLVETLVHLPPLPIVIDYQHATTAIGAQDQLGIFHALQLRDRVRRVVLRTLPSILDQLLVPMDESFPVLEHLSLSSTAKADPIPLLPKTFLAPNLRHLTLLGIGLPKGLSLLSSTVSLVTLTLTNIRAPSYFLPQHLVARLRSISLLEELTIGFSVPLPRPSAERELLHELETPVTLPVLKCFTFRGVGAYLDSFVAQIRAPLLEQLSVTLFNQIAFALPHLSHFVNTTGGIEFSIAKIVFEGGAFSVVADHHRQQLGDSRPPSFGLHVICNQFDWQIDCAAQICSALMTMLAEIEQLSLDFEGQRTPAEWQDDAVDGATWRELLGPFTGARELRICHSLVWELSCALRSGDEGLDPGLLPSLEVLAPEVEEEHAGNAFASFVDARQVVGRPVRLSPSPVSHEQLLAFSPSSPPEVSPEPSNPEADPVAQSLLPYIWQRWFRRDIINP